MLILSILIVVHEFGHFFAAKRVGVRVEEFCLGFGAKLFKRKKGDTEYGIASIPLGGYVKLAGDNLEEYKGDKDEYLSKSPGERFQIIFCGPVLNYILGFLLLWFIFFAGYPTLTTKVGGLLDGFGAKDAGVLAGDRILAVDGKIVRVWDELQEAIMEKKGNEQVSLSVERGGKEYNFQVTLKKKEVPDHFGQKRELGLLGITPFDEIITVRHGFIESFALGLNKTWALTAMTYKGLWFMATGKLSVRESVTGLPGIFFITSKAASAGIIAVLHLIAVLSISLALFNLLPLPVLDGGHIFFLGMEKIRGRPLNIKAERIVTQIGLTLIISLAVLVTYNDILRFYGDKIGKLIQFFVR